MAEEYNPMQSNVSAVERAKKKRAGTVREQAGKTVTTDPKAAPAKKPTEVKGPTRLNELKERAAKVYQQRRPVGEGGAGRLQTVTPKKTPKKYAAPKAQLGRKGPGQMQRERAQVDVKTGKVKPTKTYGERAISYLEGLGTKVAPPGSVTRLRETGARAPRTMDERLGSIGRTASRTFPGKATRPGGILDIPALAARGKGPGLKAQKGTPEAAKRRAAMSLAEKKRKGLRVTGADVPSAVPKAEREVSPGVREIKRTEAATEGHLGKFVGRGTPTPVQKKVAKAPVRRKKAVTPKKELTFWEKLKAGAAKAGTAFVKAGAEMQRESQRAGKPAGKYGTVEQRKKLEAGVKRAVVPKKFKEKK